MVCPMRFSLIPKPFVGWKTYGFLLVCLMYHTLLRNVVTSWFVGRYVDAGEGLFALYFFTPITMAAIFVASPLLVLSSTFPSLLPDIDADEFHAWKAVKYQVLPLYAGLFGVSWFSHTAWTWGFIALSLLECAIFPLVPFRLQFVEDGLHESL